MDQEYIFKAIQKSVTNTPLILVGSGASAPHGLPSMSVLGQHLIDQLGDKYHGTPCWDIFEENIANDQDLERALTGIELGRLVSGRTKIDILVTPLTVIVSGSIAGLIFGPPISSLMTALGGLINWGTVQQPFLMGIVVSVLMGMILTLPISSAALGVILNLSGLAAGAATVGCCCNMVGFAVASFRENRLGGLLAQGVGTSMLQVPNIVRKPLIWLPAIISSAVLGPVGTMLLHMENNATGSGMGTSGLVGQIMTWQVMAPVDGPALTLVKILLIQVILPAAVTLAVSEFMRKKGWIQYGDMKLDL